MKFAWSAAAQKLLELLKEALVSSSVLAHPNYLVQFEVYWYASFVLVGAVLTQGGKPITHAFRILNSAERTCSITGKRCLVIIWH